MQRTRRQRIEHKTELPWAIANEFKYYEFIKKSIRGAQRPVK